MTQFIKSFQKLAALLVMFTFTTAMFNAAKAQTYDASGDVKNEIVFAPTAFTPNGDGIDDVFNLIVDENAEVVDFRVFNRGGSLIWAANKNAGWDGSYNGAPQGMDAYVYCAVVIDKTTGLKVTKKGDVTLIR